MLRGFIAQAVQAEREEEARRLAQEALTKKEEEAAARRCLTPLKFEGCSVLCG